MVRPVIVVRVEERYEGVYVVLGFVKSTSDVNYHQCSLWIVDGVVTKWSCTCRASIFTNEPCKHVRLLYKYVEGRLLRREEAHVNG